MYFKFNAIVVFYRYLKHMWNNTATLLLKVDAPMLQWLQVSKVEQYSEMQVSTSTRMCELVPQHVNN